MSNQVLHPSMEGVEVIIERDGGLLEAFVPVGNINNEEVAVDDVHVTELAASMEKEALNGANVTGQLSPVLLADVAGEKKFPIIDGFHRSAALERLGRLTVYATIKPDVSWEDVIDLRIMTARSHKKVHFPRIVEWVEDAWQRTEWAEKISVSTACQMLLLDNSGSKFGVVSKEAHEVKQWMQAKCDQWGVNVSRLDQYLRTARTADPELVKAARERAGGHKLEVVTPQHLREIARTLPGNFTLQRIVADGATSNNLTIPQTRALALAVAEAADEEAAKERVVKKAWLGMDTSAVSLVKTRYAEIDPSAPEAYTDVLRQKFFDTEVLACELLIERAVLTGAYVPAVTDNSIPRVRTALSKQKIEFDDQINKDFDGEDASYEPWDTQKLQGVCEKLIGLQQVFISYLWRQFGLQRDQAEDVISVAVIKFLDRANDGRIPAHYADNGHLPRLMYKFLTNTAIDQYRKEHGRTHRRQFVSLDEPLGNSNGDITLADILATPDSDEFDIAIDTKSYDLITHILPHLNARERQVLILRSYFNLTAEEMARVLGTTEGTINVVQKNAKQRILAIADKASVESLNRLTPKT